MPPPSSEVARGPGPRWFRRTLSGIAIVYLLGVFLGAAGRREPQQVLPPAFRYFTQLACLFPYARVVATEYVVQAYDCSTGKFAELDHVVYFPMHPNDKENRFHRLGHFYRRNGRVMQALDAHLVEEHNRRLARGQSPGDGIGGPIGGILLQSMRIPLPAPGERIEVYRRKPLRDYPADWRKAWYKTPTRVLRERCAKVEG